MQPLCGRCFVKHMKMTSAPCKTSYTCVTDGHWNVLISSATFGCLSGLHLATQPWTSSHPRRFFLYIQSCQLLCVSGLVQKRGKLGRSSVRHRPTQNYSMWGFKSYLIMWYRGGLPAAMKGARCSRTPGEARASQRVGCVNAQEDQRG